MEIMKLFSGSGIPATLVFISITGIAGLALGKVSFFKIKLGIAGVLFAGLLVGHLGAHPDHDVLHFVKEFGLILFVYSIGLEVGPRFVSSLKSNGLSINMLAAGIAILGFTIAIVIKYIFDIPVAVMVGVLCGAVTNTPSLGAAQQVISEQIANPGQAVEFTGMGYAVAYPFGILGIILTMILLRYIFRISTEREVEKYQKASEGDGGKLEPIHMKVDNPNMFGKTVGAIKATLEDEFVLSRIKRKEEFIAAEDETIIEDGDILYGVSSLDSYAPLELKVGKVKKTQKLEFTGKLGMRQVLVTNKSLSGKTLKNIGLSRQFPVNITRIFRSGSEFMATEHDTIEFGDTVRIVGEREHLPAVIKLLGNSVKDLSHPNVLPLLIGILLGVIIGSIPLQFPGLPAPAKLGLAGGPLLIALFLGHRGRFGKLDFYMTPSSNLFIRELGIVLFLACVGLSSGRNFVSTIADGGYMWMLYGAAITAIPLLIIGVIGHFMKLNYLTICGVLAGSMTDPPALEFANSIAPVQAQSTAYATVYPLSMFLRILLAQIFILVSI